jgi:hypothetical protein
MIEKNDIQRLISDIEFQWVWQKSTLNTEEKLGYNLTKEEKVLQYRVQRGDGFRGWSNWQNVKEVKRNEQ